MIRMRRTQKAYMDVTIRHGSYVIMETHTQKPSQVNELCYSQRGQKIAVKWMLFHKYSDAK